MLISLKLAVLPSPAYGALRLNMHAVLWHLPAALKDATPARGGDSEGHRTARRTDESRSCFIYCFLTLQVFFQHQTISFGLINKCMLFFYPLTSAEGVIFTGLNECCSEMSRCELLLPPGCVLECVMGWHSADCRPAEWGAVCGVQWGDDYLVKLEQSTGLVVSF